MILPKKSRAMSPVSAKSFEDAYKAALEKASENKKGAHPIVIGKVKDFSTQELENFCGDFLVHGELVFLTASTSWIHNKVAEVIAQWLADGINNFIGMRIVDHLAGSGMKSFVNELGCHQPQIKYSDFEVGVRSQNLKKSRAVSTIVGEVAYKNETFHELLLEGSGWINIYSDAEYCFLAKLNEVQGGFSVRLIVVEKTKGFSFQKAIFQPPERWVSACVRPMEKIQPDNFKRSQLESLYAVKIIYDGSFVFGQNITNEQTPENLVLDLARVCDGSGFQIRGLAILDLGELIEQLNKIARLMFGEHASKFP